MIKLKRRRVTTQVPKRFQQPKLNVAASLLASHYFDYIAKGKFDFKSTSWKPAKSALKTDTGGKCAYCEASTDVVAHGDVEHFRPKSIYWWLAFTFDNYLFSCQICNQSFKGDQFPISGPILSGPTMPAALPSGTGLQALLTTLTLDATAMTDAQIAALWSSENADLPHPYLEDPELLFIYEADDINKEIWVRSTGSARANRALAAVENVLGLNREELRRSRYAGYRTFAILNKTLKYLPPLGQREVIKELRLQQGRTQPFAGMSRYYAKLWGLPGPF
ncbi:hypothetical protein HNW77_07105 [Komagataeibacter sp. AV436]|uniref:HNH nuclease domain-containing protein n=1 Tax=Komagataeibacter melomenusus TaxID=2766578 RepID=A0ABX2AE80_9PROT|nr:hypothetical protein [Komagataeibacter melomenusus]MBV1830833.1 hypothetical protein [Komagataeibacter melomenusus]NPC66159.1 hypothetical protein [Komagataeibacter melomenusus]